MGLRGLARSPEGPAEPGWRARSERSFPGFTLQATRGLWVFLVVVPLLGLAALNTGNNALYLLLAVSLGSFVASGALSRHTLASLRVTLRAPGEVFAAAPVALALSVRNRSRWLPAAGVVCRLVDMPGHVLLPTVPPRGEVETRFVTAFPRRGRVLLPAVRVEVRLPLGFFVKVVRRPQSGEVVVFPRSVRGAAPRWAGFTRAEEAAAAGQGRSGGEVEFLREFRSGDDRRDIHWKQTARQQRLIVMQRRAQAPRDRFLVLDRQLPRRDDASCLERFEHLVSEVSTAAWLELQRGGRVGLVIGAAVLPAAGGRRQARRVMTRLALVRPVGPGEDPTPVALGAQAAYRLVDGR